MAFILSSSSDLLQGTAVFSLWLCDLWAGSVLVRLFLFRASYNILKFSTFWWSDLVEQTDWACNVKQGQDITVDVSFLSECQGFGPSDHFGWEGRGMVAACWAQGERVTQSLKNKGEELTLSETLQVRDRSPLLLFRLSCLPFLLSFSLPLSLVHSLSSLAICMWFRHRLRGRRKCTRGKGIKAGREREQGRKSTQVCFTGHSLGLDSAQCRIWRSEQ